MKREFLEGIEINGAKLTKEVIDSIMSENGKDIEAGKSSLAAKEQEITTLTTERDGLKTQIADRDKDIKALRTQAGSNEELSNKLNELQTKYDTDTNELKTKLDSQAKDFSTDKFFTGYKFKSELAKKAAMAEFKTKEFKVDETGNFVGGKEFMDELMKSDPEAFVIEDNGGNGGAGGNAGGNNSDNGGIRLRSGISHGNAGSVDYDSMSDDEYFAAKAKENK